MKQLLEHLVVKKRKESMRIHRKRLKNFLNNCTVVLGQCRIFRILFQVNYRGVGESSRPRQSHKLEIGGANPSPATIFNPAIGGIFFDLTFKILLCTLVIYIITKQ